MADIVGIHGGPVPEAAPTIHEVVSDLQGWLEKAKSGEIIAVAVAATYRDGSHGKSLSSPTKDNALAGALFTLMRDVAD